MRTAWFDASSGASGDMVLGALLGAGVPLQVIQDAVDAVSPEPVTVTVEQVDRQGFLATRCRVQVTDSSTDRNWATIRALITSAALEDPVREFALAIFGRLAEAEAAVHGRAVDEVHFHEVGALDSIADVVGAAAGFAHLGLTWISCSPIALGGGWVATEHGRLPVPVPAVAELLRGIPSYGGPLDRELTTPTGAAILAVLTDEFGTQPPMVTEGIGLGAGGADPAGHANVLRLFVGAGLGGEVAAGGTGALVIEANIDDLDPRLWPEVIASLLAAGASDAWLTPILMKKGRPAHTLHVLVAADATAAVRREIFRQTSTIGVREQTFAKVALDRSFVAVEIDGHTVAVKLAHLDGELMNVQPEFEDVAATARALGLPVKEVLARASALAREVTVGNT
jgi:pyridinium-3,5-bisthiocarboxylic acid mononucleotide nickel chelatase